MAMTALAATPTALARRIVVLIHHLFSSRRFSIANTDFSNAVNRCATSKRYLTSSACVLTQASPAANRSRSLTFLEPLGEPIPHRLSIESGVFSIEFQDSTRSGWFPSPKSYSLGYCPRCGIGSHEIETIRYAIVFNPRKRLAKATGLILDNLVGQMNNERRHVSHPPLSVSALA